MNLKKTIGLITIGQSPRPDVTADFEQVWGETFHIIEGGALDGLSEKQITALAPCPGETDLITKLSNGKAVYVSHERLIPYIKQAVDQVVAQGADTVILLCTGEFAGLTADITILQPYTVLGNSVASVLQPGNKVIVLVPTEGQVVEASERWGKRGFEVTNAIVIPPFDQQGDLFTTSQLQEIQDSAAIIADCFGFDTAFTKKISATYHKPIFVPRLLLAHLLMAIL